MPVIHQNPVTIITPVIPSKVEQLRSILNSIQNPDVEANKLIPFSKLQSIHFARFVILEGGTENFPAQLVYSSNFDGEEKDHLAELIREAKDGLEQLYSYCVGFDGDLQRYWAAHKVPVKAFYNGHPGLSVEQIRKENLLRNTIADLLGQASTDKSFHNLSAVQIKEIIASFIKNDIDYEWAIKDKGLGPFQKFLFQSKALLAEIAKVIVVLLLAGFSITYICKRLNISVSVGFLALFVSLGAGFLVIKKKLNLLEETDSIETELPTPKHVNELMHAENFQVQNQLTHLVGIKQGSFRLRALKFVLGSINFLAKTFFNKGELGTIPSIHFARWVIIDNGKRLIFFSNYDGSWENYLGDFIDKASIGLTAVWSNTRNFPKTRNLIQEGARDEQQFKEWARHLQISTQVWYSAYKTLSVQNINNNAFIHSGLFRNMDEAKAQEWLDRIFFYKS